MTELPHQTTVPVPDHDDSSGMLDQLIVIARHKRFIFKITLGAALAAAMFSLLSPSIYTASTKLLPPQQSSTGMSSLLGQLGSQSGLLGIAQGAKSSNDLYIAMLGSRAVADRLIGRFDLTKVYKVQSIADTRDALGAASKFLSSKSGLITVSVEDRDAKRAATLANAYVEELHKLTQSFAVTEAARRRLFFEKQLDLARTGLSDAEGNLKKIQEKTGLIELGEQGRTIISAVASLRAQVSSREVQLGAMRTFATENNPDVIRLQQEIVELKAQLGKMEMASIGGNGDTLVPSGKVPAAGMEYVKRLRDVKYYENIVALLANQFEAAKIDEAKDYTLIQVLDKAIAPETRTRPKRRQIVLSTAITAAVSSIFWVLAREALDKARQDPDQARRLDTLRKQLWR